MERTDAVLASGNVLLLLLTALAQPVDVLAVRLHVDAASVVSTLRKMYPDDEQYVAVLHAELNGLLLRVAERQRHVPTAAQEQARGRA